MARVWMESLLKHAPGTSVVIGLVDSLNPGIDYKTFAPAEIIPIAQIGIPDLEAMVLNYRIIELNTAIKPFLFQYLFKRMKPADGQQILYFDPDIRIFAPLDPILNELAHCNILLTPHILSPVPENHGPFGEHLFLNYGIYNLGFCGMTWTPETEKALTWWRTRLTTGCKDDVRNGLFVDQLWMNLVPLFFNGIHISRHLGLDVAYWNLHERELSFKDGAWFVNESIPLIFYHFSSFEYQKPESLGRYSIHYNLGNRPEMRPLFDEYRALLQARNYPELRQIPCTYVRTRIAHLEDIQRKYYQKHPFRRCLTWIKKRFIPRKLMHSLKNTSPEDDLVL